MNTSIKDKNISIITREGHSVGRSEEFKRPDHADFSTSTELKKEEFCGIRHNAITDSLELWVLGELRVSMPFLEARLNPRKWEKKIQEVFGLDNVKTMGD